MQRRTVGRGALLRALGLALLLGAPTAAHAQAASADPALAAELGRVAEINQRRRALTLALTRQRTELGKVSQQSAQLQQQLAAPDKSVEAAPAVRAKLLDQLADALGSVVYLTGQLNSGHEEQAELEAELTELLAGADAAATVASADPEQRLGAMKAKQRALLLKTRARAGGALPSSDKVAKLAGELEAWKQQQRDASAQLGKVDAEPRFASLTATPPRNMKKAPAAKGGKVETQRACSVRDVDWKNITIDVGGRAVQLIDGQGRVAPGSASVRIKDVSYGDSNANGREEVFLLVDREEVTRSPDGAELASELDGLYVLESAPDCSMRQLADLALTARGLSGKPVSGGYDHDGLDALRELRWTHGVLRVAEVKPRIARVIR